MLKQTCCAMVAFAASSLTPIYAAGELTQVRYNPDPEKELTSVSKIQLQFMEANSGISGHVDVSGITFSRKNGSEIFYALEDPATDYARLYLQFGQKGSDTPVEVSTDGVYTLHVPEGAVVALGTGYTNAEINVDFTINSSASTPMTAYTLDPQPGEVEEIGSIKLSFPDSKGLDWFHKNLFSSADFSAITLTSQSNPAEQTYRAVKKGFDMAYTVTLGFVDADGNDVTVTTPGDYLLDIPAGMFQQDYTDNQNRHITAEYTIAAPAPVEFSDFTSVPADGESVGRMASFQITFPHLSDGLDYPVAKVGQIELTSMADNKKYYGINTRVQSSPSGRLNTLLVDFGNPDDGSTVDNSMVFTEAGEYEAVIPAGVLKAYGTDIENHDIRVRFTVDPYLNFTYRVTPEPSVAHAGFENFTISAGEGMRSIGIKNTEGEPAISLGQIRIPLNWNIIDSQNVEFSIAHENSLAAGEWTVTIPSGFFEGINHNGTAISNTSDIVFPYIIKTPATFSWSIDPADGAVTEFLRNIIIHFTGDNLRGVAVDTSAGTPVMTGRSSSLSYTLTGKGTSYCAILSVTDVASVPEDTYDIVIPAGYIVTTDSDQLRAAVPEIRSTITVKNSSVDDYTDGILFLNEGWYGNDTGSLNFYSNAGDWTYNAFLSNNPDHRLGTTSQYGQSFGNRIYLVSKQSGTESGITGGQFTVLDAATLGFIGQIDRVPDQKAQPRAFCAWDEHKGYLSTDRQIYVVDLDKPEILSVVPGTDRDTSFDSYGEMLRFADRVFAIRQSTGVDVIDPATENVVTIPAELAEAFAVTADGSLYVATRNESNEFIRISPTAPYQLQMIDIENDKSKIANIWSTWRKAPIAAGTTGNVVYYVTQAEAEANPAGARHIARYDFDTETFTPDFITLPGVAQGYDADWMLYGEGISVNPADGKILLSAVESGYGVHYSHNRVFMADPHTGEILADETLEPKDGYWFPAMTLYPDFSAPSIDIAMIDLPYGPAEFTLSLSEATVLRSGNIHLVNYQAYGTGCEVDKCDQAGVFTVRVPDSQAYELRLCAEYQGKKTEVTVKQSAAAGIATVESDIRYAEVYDISGIIVLRNASEAEIRRLAPGIYIAGGRKFMVRH